MTNEQQGLLYMGIMALTIILIIRWFVRGVKKSYHSGWFNKMANARSLNGIAILLAIHFKEVMHKEIRNKKFATIDWKDVIEKVKLTPGEWSFSDSQGELHYTLTPEVIPFLNLVMMSEMEIVLLRIDNRHHKCTHHGPQNNNVCQEKTLYYVQEAWLGDASDRMVEGLMEEMKRIILERPKNISYADLHSMGMDLIKQADNYVKNKKLDAALSGNFDYEEPEYEVEYYDYDNDGLYVAPVVNEVHHHHHESAERPIEHKPFPERKPAAQPKPRPEPVRQKVFKVQRMDRGGGWSTKYSTNNIRIAENQMRNFQNGAYRLQDENQPNVRWRIVDEDERVVF